MKKIQQIFTQAKSTSNASNDDTVVDREIYKMIVKNTIDALFELFAIANDNSPGVHYIRPKQMIGIQFIDVRDLPILESSSIAVSDGHNKRHLFSILSPEKVLLLHLDEAIRKEELYSSEFIILEKVISSDLIGQEQTKIKLASLITPVSQLKQLHLSRNLKTQLPFTVNDFLVVYFRFPETHFGQDIDILVNMHRSDTIEQLNEFISRTISRLVLPLTLVETQKIGLTKETLRLAEIETKAYFSHSNLSLKTELKVVYI